VVKEKYKFSFTGASALVNETLIIAEQYQKLGDWECVEEYTFDNNLLNKIKRATFKREFREIKKRLSLLTCHQLQVLINGDLDDANAMILLSLVKAYPFFRDFIVEVLRTKYLLFDRVLIETDYNKFINTKSLSHQELNSITESTAKKVKQRIFTLLEQVGLITQIENGTILKPFLSNQVLNVITEDSPVLLATFLFSNQEIQELLKTVKHA
jgi:hypothetical protein